MSILSADKQYVTVEKGDNLWVIAKRHLGDGTKYKALASRNGISNPDLIYVGQKIYLYKDVSSSTPSSSSSSVDETKATIEHFGIQSNTDNTLFATWKWSKGNTASYKVLWTYTTGDGVSFVGNNSTITVDKDAPSTSRQSTYSIPSNAKTVTFKVKPISETKKQGNKEVNYWTAEWSNEKKWTDTTPLATPGTPSIEIEDYKLTASLDGINIDGATHIQFQVVQDNKKTFVTSNRDAAAIVTGYASHAFNIKPGHEYKVRCRAHNSEIKSYSEWSAYSSSDKTIPAIPSKISTIKATSKTSVYLEWDKATAAESYELEYTTKKEYFDGSSNTTKVTAGENTHWEITGLETGNEYFFRVRAKNAKGDSDWSGIVSIVVGTTPSAPTTWSSTTTAIVGENVNLYWVHNSQDSSSQTYAELELTIDDGSSQKTINVDIKNNVSADEDYIEETSVCTIDTTNAYIRWEESGVTKELRLGVQFEEGVQINWRVRTAGITNEYGEWSTPRTIDIYAQPTLDLTVRDLSVEESGSNSIDTVTAFPFYIYALPGPASQAPIGYHLSIISNETYETADNIGNVKTVSAGEAVYSKYFDTTDALLVKMSAGNVDLSNNIEYTVTCTVSMNSGLTVTDSKTFTVSWIEVTYVPNAEIGIDTKTYTASIRPYCETAMSINYIVESSTGEYTTVTNAVTYLVVYSAGVYVVTPKTIDVVEGGVVSGTVTTTDETVYHGIDVDGNEVYYCVVEETTTAPTGEYTKTTETVDQVFGEPVTGAFTTTGEQVYHGTNADDEEIYYCTVVERVAVQNVLLSVYRREFDGTFTELATGLDNTKHTFITDPHPSLDYARYRIVATTADTGAVSYYDMPAYPVGGIAVIIQWDEEWTEFDTTEDAVLEQPEWTGSMLTLPYNVDVSDNTKPDVSLIEYIGRTHPVSYYGTHIGQSATWNVEVEKSDKETLYALRRLARWMGDVYVREPSGSGYWANITVSFSQKHRDMTIPVTLNITRVEGGV